MSIIRYEGTLYRIKEDGKKTYEIRYKDRNIQVKRRMKESERDFCNSMI